MTNLRSRLCYLRWLYDLLVRAYGLLIAVFAVFGHPKAQLFVTGRRRWLHKLPQTNQKVIWIHCASLGEYEQAVPLMECLRQAFPELFIAVTFFSPSGYEARKNNTLPNWVGYLPMDTPQNARDFIQKLSPIAAILVKYELWYHFLDTCHSKAVPLFLVGGRIHEKYWGLTWGKIWFKHLIGFFHRIYTLDETSAALFAQLIPQERILHTGDTRYDRVAATKHLRKPIDKIVAFVDNKPVIIAGSVWEKDITLLIRASEKLAHLSWKMIWVPHEPTTKTVNAILNMTKGISLTELEATENIPTGTRDLVIDRVGLLSSVYSLAWVSWVGGAFGSGLHNILEPLSLAVPTAFGNKIDKFPEAQEAVAAGIAHSCQTPAEFVEFAAPILTSEPMLNQYRKKIQGFMKKHEGATSNIWCDLYPKIAAAYSKK